MWTICARLLLLSSWKSILRRKLDSGDSSTEWHCERVVWLCEAGYFALFATEHLYKKAVHCEAESKLEMELGDATFFGPAFPCRHSELPISRSKHQLLLEQQAMPSRWAESADDAADDARRRADKEEKKRLKAEKQRKAHEEQDAQQAAQPPNGHTDDDNARPPKRRRLSQDDTNAQQPEEEEEGETTRPLLRFNPPTWQPSRSVAHFHRLNAIEEGSYGYVSRARDRTTGAIVALKKLKLNPTRDAGFPVTALREIQCLRAAKHRHVVDLREVVCGEERDEVGDVYLVMEFLEHDLKTLQEEMQDPFSASEVKTLLLQLASAVAFLHDHWILHRDLKTSNILLNNRGEIKLADFGMARFVGDPAPANLTQLVVTLWYRSPELLLGATSYDGSVDIWSLGCIFGELLTRQPLLQGKNEVDQLSKVSGMIPQQITPLERELRYILYTLHLMSLLVV